MSSPHDSRLTRFALACALAVASPALAGVLPVSPGATDRLLEVASACPAFSWSAAEGAVAYELAVLDITEAESPVLVYSQRVEGAALSWTPSREACLAPGRAYGWLVRAEVAGSGLGEWSAPRRFRVPGAPSIQEVEAALALLERWRAAQPGVSGSATGSAALQATGKSSAANGNPATADAEAPLAPGGAAIRGEMLDTTGVAYGVLGITGTPEGAGVVARNLSTGPDLILDGAAQGEPDTLLTHAGLDRPAASETTFNFKNSGAGALTLRVDGAAVDTALTPIAWSRLTSVPAGFADGVDNDTTYTAGSHLVLDGTLFRVLDGRDSGLDADELDGLHADQLQARVTGVCGPGQAMQGITVDGTVVCYDMPAPPRVVTVSDVANNVGWYNSIAIGTDGFPVIAYHDSTDSALRVAKCNDASCDGGNETITRVHYGTDIGEDTSIAIGSDGLPVISYLDNFNHALWVAKCLDAACSASSKSVVDAFAWDSGSIAIGADGLPVISYYDSMAGGLAVAKCNDLACAPGGETITIVDASGAGSYSVGEGSSIAIGVDGFPVISYYVDDTGEPYFAVAKCNDHACAGGGEIITGVSDYGPSTSLAIGADGFPVISFYDESSYRLGVAKCHDAACAGVATISIVDQSVMVGQHSSLAIGTDGLPVISYHNESDDTLRVAKCNDAACSGGNEAITTVDDPVNQVGWHNAIAIGSNGFPVIVYHDNSAGALKVVKCNSASCTW